jgi:hypothetical protein
MTDSLRQLDLILEDLEYFRTLEDFYNEHHPEPEPPNIPYGASAMFFTAPKPNINSLEYRLRNIRSEIYNKLDKVISKQTKVINLLKKKK